MRVILESEARIRIEMVGAGFEITPGDVDTSPYHLLAASLATCTALTVGSWAAGAGVGTDRLTISVTWQVVDGRPKRVARIDQTLDWPELTADRVPIAERVAQLCPIHATLNAGTEATSHVRRE